MNFPKGSAQVNAFYGVPYTGSMQPSEEWQKENLVEITLPYPMRLAWALHDSVTKITVHKKVAESLVAILTEVYDYARIAVKKKYGTEQTTAFYDAKTTALLSALGLDIYGGAYNFREKRGLHEVSLHAYGAAIDLDPDHNPLQHGRRVKTTFPAWFIAIFEKYGATWGGSFRGRKDAMHFQFASGV